MLRFIPRSKQFMYGIAALLTVGMAAAQTPATPIPASAPATNIPAGSAITPGTVTLTPDIPTPPAGQTINQATGPSTITVTTRIVVLDVVATDKKGNLVEGLTKDDFTVYENAVPQRIRYFETPAKHIMAPDITINGTAELQKKAPDAPVNILVLDELNTRFQDEAYARYSINRYIDEQPAKLAVPTQFIAISHEKFDVLSDYTQDGASIKAALKKHLTIYPWTLINDNTGDGVVQRLAMSLGALEQVAAAIKGHPGRKNIIWVGRGFPGINVVDVPDQIAAGITGAIQKCLNIMRDARITLYTIDPTITSTQQVDIGDPNALDISEDVNGVDPFATVASFTTLAPATGGKAFYGRNDVDAEVATSIRDGQNYYTLSYAPSDPNMDAALYRRIRIKVDKPGVTATTRNGYYSHDDVKQPVSPKNQLKFDINSAASTTLPYTGLSVIATPTKDPGSFILQINPRGFSWKDAPDGSVKADLIVEAVSFGAKGKFLAKTTDGLTLSLKSLQELQVADAATTITAKASMPPGTLRVRFVVRDSSSGRIGTADYTVK